MSTTPPPIDEKARREARLAEALRSNLRRRKAGSTTKVTAAKAPKAET